MPSFRSSTAPTRLWSSSAPGAPGGAERTYQYLAAKGVATSRLLILEKGQAGWNCPDLTEKQ